jgi:RNA polymerase sigma-70 factor (ECF subfamily)
VIARAQDRRVPVLGSCAIVSSVQGAPTVNEQPHSEALGSDNLDLITTQWSLLGDTNRFVVRYDQAVRRYLQALLGNAEDADDVAHEFFVRVVVRGFERADPDRGRFRDYLKIAVRNAALSHLRQKQRCPRSVDTIRFTVPDPESANREWLRQWQACVLERAWRALERHEHVSPGNLAYTVLRIQADHADEDSRTLADRVAAASGRALHPDAFRKQLSRARRLFAKLIVAEVAQTLQHPTGDDILAELAEIGLREYVDPYLAASASRH